MTEDRVQQPRRITVAIGESFATYELLEDDVPETAQALWDSLPIDGKVTHAQWAGPAVWMSSRHEPLRSVENLELPVTSIYPGTMVVRPQAGVMKIFLAYGAAESRGPTGRTYATPVAQLADPPDQARDLMAAMHATWEHGCSDIVISRSDEA